MDSGREASNLVHESFEAREADSCSYHLAIADQQDPLIGLSFDVEGLSNAMENMKESENEEYYPKLNGY